MDSLGPTDAKEDKNIAFILHNKIISRLSLLGVTLFLRMRD